MKWLSYILVFYCFHNSYCFFFRQLGNDTVLEVIWTDEEKEIYRIVNGEDVKLGEMKFVAGIKNMEANHIFCSGVIVGDYLIFFAAHCVDKKQTDYSNFRAVVGTVDRFKGGKFHEIEKIEYIDLWDGDFKHGYDIAAVYLKTPIDFKDKKNPADKIEVAKGEPVPDEECLTAGWGAARRYGKHVRDYKEIMQKAKLPIIDKDKCDEEMQKRYIGPQIINSMACIGHLSDGYKINICDGDSGSPVVCWRRNKYVLYGVISWNYGCQKLNHPNVYTNIAFPPVQKFARERV